MTLTIRRRTRALRWAAMLLSALGCGPAREAAPDRPAMPVPAVPVAGAEAADSAPLDTVVVQDSADWAAFSRGLPHEPVARAAALDGYRARRGLPLGFFVRTDAPERFTRALRTDEDEMSCGTTATAFVRRMPAHHRVLVTSPAIEFDSTGRILRRWALPDAVEFWTVVVGVHGDELQTQYVEDPDSVFLRFRPDGEFRVTAERPRARTPRTVRCPTSPAFEGLICESFMDGATERRIAHPTPCT